MSAKAVGPGAGAHVGVGVDLGFDPRFETTVFEGPGGQAEARPEGLTETASPRDSRVDAKPWRVWKLIIANAIFGFLNALVIVVIAGYMLPGVLTAPYLWTEIGIVARAAAALLMVAPCLAMLNYQTGEKRRSTWAVAFIAQVATVAAVGVFMWVRVATHIGASEPVYLAGYPVGVIVPLMLGKVTFFNAILLLTALGRMSETPVSKGA